MRFRSETSYLIVNLISFGVLMFLLAYLIVNESYSFVLPIVVILIFVTLFKVVQKFNKSYDRLVFFLEAIKNEDSSMLFSENVKNKSLRRLHKNLNSVNRHIANIRIENKNNERFLSELIDHSSTGLMSINSNGIITNINKSASKLLSIEYISNLELLKQVNEDLYKILVNFKPNERKTVKISYKNKITHLIIQSSILKFQSQEYKIFSVQDIKREIDENEIDSWQKLIRVMAHEIMNSIAPITSLSNTLSRFFTKDNKPKQPSDINEAIIQNSIDGLAIIEERGKALTNFVENYRKLARIPVPKPTQIETASWVNSLSMLFKERLKTKDIKLRLVVDKDFESFETDEKLLNQVVINLISNAIYAMQGVEEKLLEISIFQNKHQQTKIKVKDSGVGMSPDVLDKVFIPFFTTKEEGDGIGLSLSRQIIRKLGGALSVESEEGKGACFSIVI